MPYADYDMILSEENQLGKGSFGNVFKIKRKEDKKEFAVKIIMTANIEQAKKEAEIQKVLDHPNIVKIIDYFTQGQQFYIVMDLFENDLSKTIKEYQGNLKYELVVKIFTQLIQILSYLQEKKVIHRDIKPQNLLVDKENNIYLTDFGIARNNSNTSTFTKNKGTERYMAPEVYETNSQYQHQPDIWAAGIILYELMTKNNIFQTHSDSINYKTSIHLNGYEDPQNLQRFFPLIFVKYEVRISAHDILLHINSQDDFKFRDPYSEKIYQELCAKFDKIDLNFIILKMQIAIKTEVNQSIEDLESQDLRIQQINPSMEISQEDITKIRQVAICLMD